MSGSREIAEVLRALPIQPERAREITSFAQQIALCSILAGVEEAPTARAGGAKRAEDDLLEFGKLCRSLRTRIQKMRRESREAMKAHLGNALDLDRLFIEMSRSLEAARRAYHSLPAEDSGAPRGANPRHRARAVTYEAASAYERLTGERASYSTDHKTNHVQDPFVGLVATLFDLLGIEASAEAQGEVPH